MAVTVRSFNLAAERVDREGGIHALDSVLAGADVVAWQEIEKYVRDGVLDGRRGRHIVPPGLSRRPMTINPRTVEYVDTLTFRADRFNAWPRRSPLFRARQFGLVLREKATGEFFAVVNVHMIHRNRLGARRRVYQQQVKAVLAMVAHLEIPVIVVGDWNATRAHKYLAPLKDAGFRPVTVAGVTHGSDSSGKCIDFHMVRDARAYAVRVLPVRLPRGADHRPVTATFDIT